MTYIIKSLNGGSPAFIEENGQYFDLKKLNIRHRFSNLKVTRYLKLTNEIFKFINHIFCFCFYSTSVSSSRMLIWILTYNAKVVLFLVWANFEDIKKYFSIFVRVWVFLWPALQLIVRGFSKQTLFLTLGEYNVCVCQLYF